MLQVIGRQVGEVQVKLNINLIPDYVFMHGSTNERRQTLLSIRHEYDR